MKRVKKKRGGINGSVLKEKEGDKYDDADSWDEHDFDVGGEEGSECGDNGSDEGEGEGNNEESEEEKEEGKGDGSCM